MNNNNINPRRVVTGKSRLSYVHLTKPRAAKPGDTPKYGVTLLIPKSDIATKQRMDAAVNAAILEATAGKWNGVRPPQPANPIYDGDGVRPNGESFSEECRGCWVVTASSEQKPEVVDTNLNPIMNASEIYSGMYAHVSVNFFGYFNSGKKGIGCGLGNVQKVGDGEPLAASQRSAADDFAGGGGYTPAMPAYPQQPNYPAPGYAVAQPAPAYQQQPVYQQQNTNYQHHQQPAPQPQQPVYQQPIYTQQPIYPQQQPQIDPITGRPIVGQVMGL